MPRERLSMHKIKTVPRLAGLRSRHPVSFIDRGRPSKIAQFPDRLRNRQESHRCTLQQEVG